MAGLGGLERRLGRLGIAELADEDDVRVLPQRPPEGLAERLRVQADLALVDDAREVFVQELDRVLDRDDVLAPRPVDVVQHRRERRRLARAGRACDEDEPAVLLGQSADTVRQLEGFEARNLARDHAERERDRAALHESVHSGSA